MPNITPNEELTFPKGTYVYTSTVVAGTVTMQVKPKGGQFRDMTDAVFSTNAHGKIALSPDLTYRALIDSGNSLDISITDSGL
jgi:hypothetical protein